MNIIEKQPTPLIVVAHPDDDILFFTPDIFKVKNLTIVYVYAVGLNRRIGVAVAHLLTGLRVKRFYLQHPWDQELSLRFVAAEEEVWTHDPGDLEDHPHHQRVARAVLRDAKGLVRVFTGYGLPKTPINVSGWDYLRKAAMWRIYSLFDPAVRHIRVQPFPAACLRRCQWVYA